MPVMAGYTGGRIRKIKVHNFMTYDDVEIYPKKGLNLIVGLNGSGKSSIMCAICLGLAGKPHFTGRATQLSDFIKHGCPEAEIELELESGSRNSVIIHRKLKENSKCEWTLNSSPSNQNEVASAVKKFNIDTSNLCQFLPQEKVAEFSRMDKKQRLENMLQAIGEPHLFELFNELKKLHKSVAEVEQSVKKYQNNRSSAEEENERISDEVKKQESRFRLKKELDDLFKQKKYVIYQNIYEEVQKLKEKERKLSKEVEALRKEKDVAVAEEDNLLNLYRKYHKNYQGCITNQKNLLDNMTKKSNAITNFHEQIENTKIELKNILTEKEAQKKRLHDINKQLEGLERVLSEEMSKMQNFNEEEQLNSEALAQVQEEISELYQNMEKASAERNQVDYSLTQLKTQLSSLRDEQNKKMANLKRRDKYTYQAACWLLENKDRFKFNIYLPIMLEININSSDNSKYVENVIGFRDMIAFVCEDKGDCERLTDILKKQQNLPVNIVMAPDIAMSNFVSPELSRENRQYGLECFIVNLFTAPEPVMRYLCACYGIHRIPVAKSVVAGNCVERIVQSFPVFFSDNMRISGKRSRYGNRNLSVKKDFITVQNLLVHSNDELQREAEQKCHVLEKELELKKKRLEEFKVYLTEKEKIQEKLRQEKKNLQERQKNVEKIKFSYLQRKKYRSQISVIDEKEENRKTSQKILSINEFKQKAICDVEELLKEFSELEKKLLKLLVVKNSHSKNLKLTKAANEDIHDKLKAAEAEYANISKEYREKKQSGRILLEEIQALGEEYVNLVQDIRPSPLGLSMDELELKINHVQAQLNLNEDNEPLVAEYNARKRKIEAIQSQINKFEGNLDELKRVIAEKKKEWLEPLLYHIRNINKKFSHYFKELSCAGEISLDIPENPDDFTHYGLQINLKFHDEESSLCELSQNHHSGGECSVAAIVFILSLQELTEVPFRCIDEINQGMDSINERKIYQLIADSVADDRCSQYFLLTPKLLMDLEYPDDVAVHIIFNSPFLHMKLDVRKHVEIAQSS